MKPNAPHLRNIMKTHRLTCRQVGEILHRHPATVRNWRMLESGNDIPDGQLRLLQFELLKKITGE